MRKILFPIFFIILIFAVFIPNFVSAKAPCIDVYLDSGIWDDASCASLSWMSERGISGLCSFPFPQCICKAGFSLSDYGACSQCGTNGIGEWYDGLCATVSTDDCENSYTHSGTPGYGNYYPCMLKVLEGYDNSNVNWDLCLTGLPENQVYCPVYIGPVGSCQDAEPFSYTNECTLPECQTNDDCSPNSPNDVRTVCEGNNEVVYQDGVCEAGSCITKKLSDTPCGITGPTVPAKYGCSLNWTTHEQTNKGCRAAGYCSTGPGDGNCHADMVNCPGTGGGAGAIWWCAPGCYTSKVDIPDAQCPTTHTDTGNKRCSLSGALEKEQSFSVCQVNAGGTIQSTCPNQNFWVFDRDCVNGCNGPFGSQCGGAVDILGTHFPASLEDEYRCSYCVGTGTNSHCTEPTIDWRLRWPCPDWGSESRACFGKNIWDLKLTCPGICDTRIGWPACGWYCTTTLTMLRSCQCGCVGYLNTGSPHGPGVSCTEDVPGFQQCTDGDTQSCGRCGTQTCSGCRWGVCKNQGVCTPNPTPQNCTGGGTRTCNNSCQWDRIGGCQDFHNMCNANQQCISVSGAGTDDCQTDTDCQNSFKGCNTSKQCITVSGTGTDSCLIDTDCPDLLPGCNSSKQCVAGGTGFSCDLANGNADCVNQPTCTADKKCQLPGAGGVTCPSVDSTGDDFCAGKITRCNANRECSYAGTGDACDLANGNDDCPDSTLSVSCTASPDPVLTGDPVWFNSTVSGGTSPYIYHWTGGCIATSANCSSSFSSTGGNHSATIRVDDGNNDYATANCPVTVNPKVAPTVSCTASPNPVSTGRTVSFNSTVSGGTGSYTYAWTDDCTGFSANCSTSFPSAGTRNATIRVDDANGTFATADCSVTVSDSLTHCNNQHECSLSGTGIPCDLAHGNDDCIDPLTISCTASPNPALTGNAVSFSSVVSGGTGPYTYSWTGDCSSTSQNCSTSFSIAAIYTSYVNVISGSDPPANADANCSVTVNPKTPLTVSCTTSPNPVLTGQTVSFNSTVAGGTGSYTYAWTDECTGSSANCSTSFPSTGIHGATIRVDSGNDNAIANCLVVVNLPISGPTALNLNLSSGGCEPPGCGNVTFQWTYYSSSNVNEKQYHFQVDNNSDFSSPEVDVIRAGLNNPSGDVNVGIVLINQSLSYSESYYWRVKVWDQNDNSSTWIEYDDPSDPDGDGNSKTFSTKAHLFPNPEFIISAQTGFNGSSILSFLASILTIIVPSKSVNFSDTSMCYNADGSFYFCKDGSLSTYTWTFGDGQHNHDIGDTTHTYAVAGTYAVNLRVCDESDYCCDKLINVQVGGGGLGGSMWWREINPF